METASTQQMRDECQKQLELVLPAYESSLKALSVLKKSDIVLLKAMKNPSNGVALAMKASIKLFWS